MSMAILRAAQGARTNGVQLIGWTSWSNYGLGLSNAIAAGMANWVDGISFHFYPFSDVDPSIGHPTAYDNWYNETNAFLDFTNCADCVRLDQWLNWMYTQIPTNFASYITEFAFYYHDCDVYANLPKTLMDPNRLAKYIVLAKAGGVSGINLFGELWYSDNSSASPRPINLTGRAAVWTAYWLQNLPFSGTVSNGNMLAYSFGSGTGKVTLAWTYEGTMQSVTAAGYSEVVDLYSNSVGTVSVLTPNITVLLGPGTLTFP